MKHSVPMSRLESWMGSHAINPKDFLRKQKLRELLYGSGKGTGL